MKKTIAVFLAGVLTTLLFVGVVTYFNEDSNSVVQDIPERHEKLIKLLNSGAEDYIRNNYEVDGVIMPAYNERTLQVVTRNEKQKENIYKYFEDEFNKAGILYKVEVHIY